MSTYGVNKYGTPSVYGADVTYDYSTEYFIATPTGYGQITLRWSVPNGVWNSFIIIRNPYGYPVDSDDGVQVFQSTNGLPQMYTDAATGQGREYYYAIFVRDTISGLWHLSAVTRGMAVKDFNTYKTMWSALPLAVRSAARNVLDNNPENTDFSDFLRLLAFEYDYEKTQAYLLFNSYSPDAIPRSLLLLLLNEFGIGYEPTISDQRMRVLAKNAIHLYQSKGSIQGVRDFVKAFSGYDTYVTVGKNLMLTYNDSSFEESVGNWVFTGASIDKVSDTVVTPYDEPLLPVDFPNRQLGSLRVTATGSGAIQGYCGDTTPNFRGIPVVSGTTYTFSVYAQAEAASRSVTASTRWYDKDGVLLSTSTGTGVSDSSVEWTRISVSAAAPSTAAYAVPGIAISGAVASEVHYFDAGQFEASAAATSFEDARVAVISLSPTRINELPNPNFTSTTDYWNIDNYSSYELVVSSGTNPHTTLSGKALEVYPTASGDVVISSDAIPVTPNEYYTFSMYGTVGSYGSATTTTDALNSSIVWLDETSSVISTSTDGDVQILRKPKSTWESGVYVLPMGHIGIESDTMKFKSGDGVTSWNLLPYSSAPLLYEYKDAASWSPTYVLGARTIGVETDTLKFKIGNGVTQWSSLEYTTTVPAWVRPDVTAKAPSNAAYAVVKLTWQPGNADMAVVVDEALMEKQPSTGAFFDGSTGYEDLLGLVWEGAPNASRSLFYRSYTPVTFRLKELLPDQLPIGSTFRLEFSA